MNSAPTPPSTGRRTTLHAQFVRQLLWPLVIAFVLASSVTALVGYRAERKELDAQRTQTLAIFARSLVKPLWDCDGATAQGIADTLSQLPIVRGVDLQNLCTDSTIQSGFVTAPEAHDPDRMQTAVIYHDEQGRAFTVGRLSIQFDPFTIASMAGQGLLQHLAIFGAMLAVVLAGAALVFRNIIGLPLARLREAILAHRAVHADTHSPARLANELTDVTHAYDELVHELQRLARHDPLTGLGNRMALEEHLAGAIKRTARQGGHGYVLLLDLDGFKPINDTYGHATGDFVLQTVAERLRATVRSTDMVARLGGDEFVIVAEGPLPSLSELLTRVALAVQAPIASDSGPLRVGTSIGAARFLDDGHTSMTLLSCADQRMYAAKQGKR